MTKKCSFCDKSAVYFRQYSGEKLCKKCFCSSIVEKTRKTISKYNMLKYGDKIAIAISGGKDSLSLLNVLNEICTPHSTELHAILIDEGIKDGESISSTVGLTNNYYFKKLMQQAFQKTTNNLFILLEELFVLEKKLKTQAVDEKDEFELFLVKLSSISV